MEKIVFAFSLMFAFFSFAQDIPYFSELEKCSSRSGEDGRVQIVTQSLESSQKVVLLTHVPKEDFAFVTCMGSLHEGGTVLLYGTQDGYVHVFFKGLDPRRTFSFSSDELEKDFSESFQKLFKIKTANFFAQQFGDIHEGVPMKYSTPRYQVYFNNHGGVSLRYYERLANKKSFESRKCILYLIEQEINVEEDFRSSEIVPRVAFSKLLVRDSHPGPVNCSHQLMSPEEVEFEWEAE